MATAEKTVSALINRQLPDFIRADHPKFKQFLEAYYRWLEDETKGNTVYHIMRSGEYRDIDNTLDPFIRLFKQELLPYFPERSELDLVKILKGARNFYVKKGSEESVKWLFRVLFNQDIEIYYPKEQILIASDGKWKLPQAFQLTLSANNQSIDPNLLEKHKATGSISKATCTIESANKTIDRTFGNEILEMYVSNVDKSFVNGENLEIPYVDENGVEQLFTEKIIGAISNIFVDSNIRTDPQQKRRGLSYNIGDPVVVFGGLSNSVDAKDAIAEVGNVTVGSIEGLSVVFPGYGYRVYSNTEAIVYSSPSDDPSANARTDIRVAGVNTTEAGNSQERFVETITVDMIPIELMANTLISNSDYRVLTLNNRNIIITVNNDGDPWYANERVYANGGSYETANFTAQILTANTGWAGGPAQIILYNVANTVPLTTTGFLVGTDKLISTQSGSVFNVTTVNDEELNLDANSQILQALKFETLTTGGIALYNIINGGFGFRQTPSVETTSYYDTYIAQNYDYGTDDHKQWRLPLNAFGKIAHVYINNPGTGYTNGDVIEVLGRGYGFVGTVTVNGSGSIISTTITDRGEGYIGEKTANVVSGTGVGAVLTPYGFGEGVVVSVETGAIGRVKDVRLVYRGFDYIDAPIVSLKVMDMVIVAILESENLVEGERVYQGDTLETATFQGIVKSYNRSTRLLRLFNYSGRFERTLPLTSQGGVVFTVDTASNVPAPDSDAYLQFKLTGLPNPWVYGNGKAKAYAEFFEGLIKFNGFYLNTDGFLSSDKKLQDANVYHNYSYIIESEKSLAEYKNSMMDIVHPIGMSMLSRTITRSELSGIITPEGIVYTIPATTGTTVTVANSKSNVVTGVGTTFTDTANAAVGDLFWLKDVDNASRSQIKVITAIDSATQLKVESDFTYMGQGTITTNNDVLVYVSGNSDEVQSFIQTNDNVTFNVFTANVYGDYTGTVNVAAGSNVVYGTTTSFLTHAAVGQWIKVSHLANIAQTGLVTTNTDTVKIVGTSTLFTSELDVGDLIVINSQVKSVVNIANDTIMNVNSVFTSNTIEQNFYMYNVPVDDIRTVVSVANNTYLTTNANFTYSKNNSTYTRRQNIQTLRVTGTSGNTITLNTAANGTVTIPYKVIPDYTGSYTYEIIKVTD